MSLIEWFLMTTLACILLPFFLALPFTLMSLIEHTQRRYFPERKEPPYCSIYPEDHLGFYCKDGKRYINGREI